MCLQLHESITVLWKHNLFLVLHFLTLSKVCQCSNLWMKNLRLPYFIGKNKLFWINSRHFRTAVTLLKFKCYYKNKHHVIFFFAGFEIWTVSFNNDWKKWNKFLCFNSVSCIFMFYPSSYPVLGVKPCT